MAALQIALEDLDGQVTKFETEIDAVRQREDRDRSLLDGGATDAKQLTELQHELETLERRQASLGGLAAGGDGAPRGAARSSRPPS